MVAAVQGSVEIEDETTDFLLQEEETNYDNEKGAFEHGKSDYFPKAKLLRLMLFNDKTKSCHKCFLSLMLS